ncbi:MAG: ATP-binding protein [Deltaproteobacteria bacterium]|jgi:hypothetical protein|nr:ATP-binding protein [Deltaproteobacteria bacterium]
MIKSVSFKNFRCLDGLTVPLSAVTMLTGTNGVGKTSVLEGLYCLFSETRLDVSSLSRYSNSVGSLVNQYANMPFTVAAHQKYNYKRFWDECPSYDKSECSVYAKDENDFSWSWKYQKADLTELADLGHHLPISSQIPIDSLTKFALWTWQNNHSDQGKNTNQVNSSENIFSRVQILTSEGGLFLFPPLAKVESFCLYLDFPTNRVQPRSLSFDTSTQLTKALKIIITPADNYDNLFILWFRLDFRVFNFIMVKNFFNF